MNKLVSVFVLMIALTAAAAAQTTPPEAIKTISGGVVNGKAASLAKPAYPPAAMAIHAEGAVNVQVLIDENGNVASATAVSGHPLLRQAAVAAALASKFSPTTLQGQPVKVTGIIVYNFVAGQSGWARVGYELASLEKVPTLKFFNTNSISRSLKPDWDAERKQVNHLEELKQAETTADYQNAQVSGETRLGETSEKTADGKTVQKVITEGKIEAAGPPNAEQIAISQSLISSLQGRLAADPTAVWKFNLGVALSRALSTVTNPNEKQTNLSALRQQIAAAPGDTPTEYLENVQKIAALLETPDPTAETRRQIAELMPQFFKD